MISELGDQGVASYTGANGRPELVYRGELSIPFALLHKGWAHIGDPGGWGGYIVDAYQAGAGARQKMFRVTAPNGKTYDFVHKLASGEKLNNSFATISPDGEWLVSGEWGEMRRLLVFPSPIERLSLPHPTATGLPLKGTIQLDHPVRDVQGCAFISATQLLCSTDDPGHDLWPAPEQLLEVTLPAALVGGTVSAHVSFVGALPQVSDCSGVYEAEGIDYQASTGDLRVEVVPPGVCAVVTTVYEYRRR